MSTFEVSWEAIEPQAAHCDDTHLHVTLANGTEVVAPLWWYPRLQNATPPQRAEVEFSAFGLHWPQIDEDLSVLGLIEGRRAPGAVPPAEAAE